MERNEREKRRILILRRSDTTRFQFQFVWLHFAIPNSSVLDREEIGICGASDLRKHLPIVAGMCASGEPPYLRRRKERKNTERLTVNPEMRARREKF